MHSIQKEDKQGKEEKKCFWNVSKKKERKENNLATIPYTFNFRYSPNEATKREVKKIKKID